jgi:hypothetical protein
MTTAPVRTPRWAELSASRERELPRRFNELVADARRILGAELPAAELSDPVLGDAAPALTTASCAGSGRSRASSRRSAGCGA